MQPAQPPQRVRGGVLVADGRGGDCDDQEDPKCTPGAISPAVTQSNLASTICRKGGCTSGIRPSTSATGKEKELNAASYGFPGSMRDTDHDHLLSGVTLTPG
ncbi:hypothetical protein [Streptomyces sp. NPDC001076]